MLLQKHVAAQEAQGDMLELGGQPRKLISAEEEPFAAIQEEEKVVESQASKITFNRILNQEAPKNKLPSKAGGLEKLSPSFMVGWQGRQVELHNRLLRWKNKGEVQGSINFDLYWCTVQQKEDKP